MTRVLTTVQFATYASVQFARYRIALRGRRPPAGQKPPKRPAAPLPAVVVTVETYS